MGDRTQIIARAALETVVEIVGKISGIVRVQGIHRSVSHRPKDSLSCAFGRDRCRAGDECRRRLRNRLG